MSFTFIQVCFTFSCLNFTLLYMCKNTFKRKYKPVPISLCVLNLLLITAVISSAWISFERPPFKTFFETYILLSWSLSAMGIVLWRISNQAWILPLSALITAAVLLWALVNPDLQKVNLPPALQSVWFVPHVMVYFLGYATVFLSAATAFIALTPHKKASTMKKVAPIFTRIAFVLLGVGLILGSLWADDAWGTYWGWDPKENWALVTWLLISAYIHLPQQMRDSRAGLWTILLIMATVGFTYLGMHLLPTAELSVHVYTES